MSYLRNKLVARGDVLSVQAAMKLTDLERVNDILKSELEKIKKDNQALHIQIRELLHGHSE